VVQVEEERLLFSAHPAPDDRVLALVSARDTFLRGSGAVPRVRRAVLLAWHWSRDVGIDPGLKEFPIVRPYAPVADGVADELLRTGAPVVSTAGEFLRGTNYGVILTDAAGVVLDFAGDRPLARAAERIGCVPGASLAEAFAGNNAIGTSLRLGRAAHYAHAEHYCDALTDWTCAAVPIRAPKTGAVIGSIDVSSYRTVSRPHQALALATRLGRVIEDTLAKSRPGRAMTPDRLARAHSLDGEIALARLHEPDRHFVVPPPAPLTSGLLAARRGQRRVLLQADHVYYLQAEGPLLRAFTDQGAFLVDAGSLSAIEARLVGRNFFRTDRSYLVNLHWVREIQPMFNRTLILVLADSERTEVPVARRRAAELFRLLGL